MLRRSVQLFLFFFNDTATTEIYTLSLHDALPISYPTAPMLLGISMSRINEVSTAGRKSRSSFGRSVPPSSRSEEHTSELQSRQYLVCRLLLEKKKKKTTKQKPVHYNNVDTTLLCR